MALAWAVEIHGDEVKSPGPDQVLVSTVVRVSSHGLRYWNGTEEVQFPEHLAAVPEFSGSLGLDTASQSFGAVVLRNPERAGTRVYDTLRSGYYTASRKVLIYSAELDAEGRFRNDWSRYTLRAVAYAEGNPRFQVLDQTVRIDLRSRSLDRPLRRRKFLGLGRCYTFGGTGTVTAPETYTVGEATWAVSVWYRFSAADLTHSAHVLWSKDSGVVGERFRLVANQGGDGKFRLFHEELGTATLDTASMLIIPDSGWHRVEVRYDPQGGLSDPSTITILHDEVEVATHVVAKGTMGDDSAKWVFGAGTHGDLTDWRYFAWSVEAADLDTFRYRQRNGAGTGIVNEADPLSADATLGAGVVVQYSGEGWHHLAGVDMPLVVGRVQNVEGIEEFRPDRRYRYHSGAISVDEARNRGSVLTETTHYVSHASEGSIEYVSVPTTPEVLRADVSAGVADLAACIFALAVTYGPFDFSEVDTTALADTTKRTWETGYYIRSGDVVSLEQALVDLCSGFGVTAYVNELDRLVAFRHELPQGPADWTWTENVDFVVASNPEPIDPSRGIHILYSPNEDPLGDDDINGSVDDDTAARLKTDWLSSYEPNAPDLIERWGDSLDETEARNIRVFDEAEARFEAKERALGLYGAEGLHEVSVALLRYHVVRRGDVVEVVPPQNGGGVLDLPASGRLYTVVGVSFSSASGYGTVALRGVS